VKRLIHAASMNECLCTYGCSVDRTHRAKVSLCQRESNNFLHAMFMLLAWRDPLTLCNWFTYCYPKINLGFWVGRSNNINSFVLYMLLIQYLQFVVFSQGGGSLISVFFLVIFVLICDLRRCLLRLFIFSNFFGTIFICLVAYRTLSCFS